MTLPDRIPPQALDMEQAVLGSMLIQPEAMDAVFEVVREDDFYREAHGIVFRAIRSLYERREPVDLLTVQNELRSQELFESIGGLPVLSGLMAATVTPSNAGYYASQVKKKAVQRKLLAAGYAIIEAAYRDDEDLDTITARCEQAFNEATEHATTREPRSMRAIVSEAFEEIERWEQEKRHITGIATGLDDLDYLTRGLQPQSLYVIAARPGMGKSALAGMWALEAAKQKHKTFIASLEMSDRQLVHRMIATHAQVDGHIMRTGYISGDDWRKIGHASSVISELPILIMDDANMTLTQLRAYCRRLARHKLGLVIVDYMQLLDAEVTRENRTREIDIIAKGLKGIAKELNVPVVALSQLSREVDKRMDHRPVAGDLRESGGIEANADCIIFPYNPAHYGDPAERKDQEPVELIVAKQRDGITGVARAWWFRRWTTFANMAKEHKSAEPEPEPPQERKDLNGPIDPMAGW